MSEFHDGPEPVRSTTRGRIYDCNRFTLPGLITHRFTSDQMMMQLAIGEESI